MSVRKPADVGVEALAVITGSFLGGAMMSIFLLTVPVLLETTQQTSQLLHQWTCVFYNGHRKGPAISVATGLIYGVAAWSKHAAGYPWKVFMVAGLTTVGMVPYTWIFMMGTNNALFRAHAGVKGGNEGSWNEAVGLIRRWSRLNAIRALFPLAGAVLGMAGTCKILLF